MLRYVAFSSSIVFLVFLSPQLAHAQQIDRLEIVLFTDDDNKDKPDEVTIQIIHRGDNEVVGEWKGGKGEDWKDKTEKKDIKFSLKKAFDFTKKNEYEIHISLNSPDNNGWHMHVRRVTGFTAQGGKHIFRDKDTEGKLFGKHKGDEGPYQHDFELAQ